MRDSTLFHPGCSLINERFSLIYKGQINYPDFFNVGVPTFLGTLLALKSGYPSLDKSPFFMYDKGRYHTIKKPLEERCLGH